MLLKQLKSTVLLQVAGWQSAGLRAVIPSGRVVLTRSHKWIKDFL